MAKPAATLPIPPKRRPNPLWALLLGCCLLSALAGCKDEPPPPRKAARTTVASLMPAATDLLVGMGAADHLVAISSNDPARPETASLPRVGDYDNYDWEQLTILRPDILIVFMAPERMPEGLRQRAVQLGIRLANMRLERLADTFAAIAELGTLVNEPAKAQAAADQLRRRLDAVRSKAAGKPAVRTLVLLDDKAAAAVGTGNFINDALETAGGKNVIADVGWPSIDRERLLALAPDAIVILLPDASAQVMQQAKTTLAGLGDVPAVARGRVKILTQWWVMQPGMHVGDLAEELAGFLHQDGAAK